MCSSLFCELYRGGLVLLPSLSGTQTSYWPPRCRDVPRNWSGGCTMPSIFPLIHVDCTQCPDKVGLVPPKLQILWNKTYKTWFHEFGVISHRDGYLHLDSLETKMKFNRSKVMFLSWNKAPSARFGDLLGLRGQKHSEALGSRAQFRYPQVVPCNGRGDTEGCHREFGPFLFTPAWKTIAAGENACIRSEKHHCIRSRFVLRDNLSISQVACPGSRSSPCFHATLGRFSTSMSWVCDGNSWLVQTSFTRRCAIHWGSEKLSGQSLSWSNVKSRPWWSWCLDHDSWVY